MTSEPFIHMHAHTHTHTHLDFSCGTVGRGACNRSLSSFLSGLKTIGSGIGGRGCAGTYLNGPVALGGGGSALTGGSLPGGVFSLEDESGSWGLGVLAGSLGTFLWNTEGG